MKRLALIPLAVCLAAGAYLVPSSGDIKREQAIAGCKSNNPIRQAAFNNAKRDAKTRAIAAKSLPEPAAGELRRLAGKNREDAEDIVKAASAFPKKPGSPKRDCEAAYD